MQENEAFEEGQRGWMRAKSFHLSAVSLYYAGKSSGGIGSYGLELGYFMEADKCVKKALETKKLDGTLSEEIKAFGVIVSEAIKTAEYDNDMIYLQPVVKIDDLPGIKGVVMVKEMPVYDLDMLKKLGYVSEPFFKNLVPYAVHKEASIYSAMKQEELSGIRELVETDSATFLSYVIVANQLGNCMRWVYLPRSTLTTPQSYHMLSLLNAKKS